MERHRMVAELLQLRPELLQTAQAGFLHIAPEQCLGPRLHAILGDAYVSADLSNPRVMVHTDLTDLDFADQSFSAVYCSHVLEHINDDLRAMKEIHRVLTPDGWAILNVPITAEATFGDPEIVDPDERFRLYGQHDHVRRYGPDYVDRLVASGFIVDVVTAADLAPEATRRTELGIATNGDDVFLCRRGGRIPFKAE